MGTGVVDYRVLPATMLIAGLSGAIIVVMAAYAARVPTSLSVALISSMVGALLAGPGLGALEVAGLSKVALAIAGSIVVGFAGGAIAYALVFAVLRGLNRATGNRLMLAQYATVAFQGLGYGANDAEKIMGLIAVAGSMGSHGALRISVSIVVVSVAAFALGMAVGGLRVAKTVGSKLFHIRPEHALAFQFAAGATVMAASLLGGPLSTTETTASAIMGVGASDDVRKVRWETGARLIAAWVFTVPAGLLAGLAIAFLLKRL